MRFSLHSDRAGSKAASAEPRATEYASVVRIQSKAMPGVVFAINRVSFGRRMELSRRIREIGQRIEFLQAGTELQEKIEANILAQEIDTMYLRWAFVGIDGLAIDGELPTVESLLEKGPEELAREIVNAIKAQCGLTEEERKN